MTPAPGIDFKRRHREGDRDDRANRDRPPGVGANSSVSPDALTRVAHGYRADRGTPALSGEFADNVRAATLPPVTKGPARGTTGAGERSMPGKLDLGKSRDTGGPTR